MSAVKCTKAIKAGFSAEELEMMQNVGVAASTTASQKSFATGGNLVSRENQCLFFKTSSPNGRSYVELPITAADVQALDALSEQSSHGKDGESVLDLEYRMAREIKLDRFGLNFDPVPEIVLRLGWVYSPGAEYLQICLSKLNIYGEGGFFKPHRDTPRGDDHIGSVVLVVKQGTRSVSFDWSKTCGDGQLGWAFLYSDCEHEVLPVTSGARLTLAYDVFRKKRPASAAPTVSTEIIETELYQALAALNKKISFSNSAEHVYAFGTKYQYPSSYRYDKADHLKGILKGVDNEINKTAKALGLKCELAYALEDADDEDYLQDRGYSRDVRENCFWLSTSSDAGMGGDGQVDECLYTAADVKLYRNLVWLSPMISYFKGADYVAYGNEPSIAHMYVGGVILLRFPRLKKKKAKKSS